MYCGLVFLGLMASVFATTEPEVIDKEAREVRMNRREFKTAAGIVLPSKFSSASNRCLDSNKMSAFLCRIKDRQNARDAAFLCAFIAFQSSDLKKSAPYNRKNVNSRFQIFTEKVRDVGYINSFSDMTEEEETSYLNSDPGDMQATVQCPTPLKSLNLPEKIVQRDYYNSKELKEMGYLLPQNFMKKGSMVVVKKDCLDHPERAFKSFRQYAIDKRAITCFLLSFQASDIKISNPYTSDTVEARSNNLFSCLQVMRRCQVYRKKEGIRVTKFCDLSEAESSAIVVHADECDYWT